MDETHRMTQEQIYGIKLRGDEAQIDRIAVESTAAGVGVGVTAEQFAKEYLRAARSYLALVAHCLKVLGDWAYRSPAPLVGVAAAAWIVAADTWITIGATWLAVAATVLTAISAHEAREPLLGALLRGTQRT